MDTADVLNLFCVECNMFIFLRKVKTFSIHPKAALQMLIQKKEKEHHLKVASP